MEISTKKELLNTALEPSSFRWGWTRFVKRLIDIAVSILGLICLWPFFILFAILIKKESSGPVFFRGKRVGKGGKIFNIIKFRTMHENQASHQGPLITARGDKRITNLGRWLRDTKVNELPQLWNVLRGDMSLVGPRPEDPAFVREWPDEARRIILLMRPGITSPASVTYRNEESILRPSEVEQDYLMKISPDKLRLDILYVQRHSLLTDLDILFMTIVMFLPRLRNTKLPERIFFTGPTYQFVRRYVSWFIIDLFISLGSISISGLIWRATGPLDLGWGVSFTLALGMSFLFSFFNSLFNLNRISWRHAGANLVLKLILSCGCVVLVLSLLFLSPLPLPKLPLSLVWLAGGLTLAFMILFRYRERLLTGMASRWLALRRLKTSVNVERGLIIGAGDQAQMVSWFASHNLLPRSISILGMVDDDAYKVGMLIGDYRVIGSVEEIPRLVEKKKVSLILYAINNISPEKKERILQICRNTTARVILVPDLIKTFRDVFNQDEGKG